MMTLQQPRQKAIKNMANQPILCHKCGAPIVFDKDHISPSGRKIPLDPYFSNEPHAKHCMYADLKENIHTETLLLDFISKMPRKKRVIGAVGRANN